MAGFWGAQLADPLVDLVQWTRWGSTDGFWFEVHQGGVQEGCPVGPEPDVALQRQVVGRGLAVDVCDKTEVLW